jgi:hypothetical protein
MDRAREGSRLGENRLELRWDPMPADWGDAMRAVVPLYRWSPWFAGALAGFSVVLLVLGQPYPGVFGLVCAVVIAAIPVLAVRTSFRSNPVAGSTVTATVDDQSLRMMTIDGTAYSDLDWARLASWVETRRGFVLRTGAGAASPVYPVPGRAFTKPAERQRFRELLQRHLGPARGT